MVFTSGRSGPRLAAIAAMALAAAAGCGEGPGIEAYETPRTESPRAPLDVEAERASLDCMYAAILPQPDADRAWFFKLVVKASDAQALREPLDEFLQSLRLEPPAAEPAWTLPAGWTAQPGDANRFATIEVPGGGASYELAVSQLPYDGQWDAFLTANVDRWARQLQEQPLKPERIAKLARQVSSPAGEATVLALVGRMAAATGPGTGMPAGHPPIAGPGNDGPPSQSPGPPAPPRPDGALKFAAPDGWKPGRMNAMRRAAFVVEADGQSAEMTVTSFPGVAGSGMGEVGSNLVRWAGEVGLRGKSADELTADARQKNVGGLPGTYAELLGPADDPQSQATLAVMLPRDGMIWFFKFKGDRKLVEAQREAFGAFLDSVRFE
ncbi:MAG: hypothetical protein KF688_17595 [Pirellulales bacterium]|nr:hypothetical protein [Pirellulales bacterium]